MNQLRIIIVSWNVRDLLERCLNSLDAACRGLEWDVVVVDNNSEDGTKDLLRALASENPRVNIILNHDNRGFAKACNQGFVNLDSKYALLLNPDTVCQPESLTRLVREAGKHPKAGIVGPKILNEDGTTQESIRRFPDVWSAAAIMLKLQHLIPGISKRYLAHDVDSTLEQDVDQVMGSCFLIRRELVEQIGGLDERFFIWFEEVDYCKEAKKHGLTVRYIPSVSITHRGGASFGQVFSYKKQKYFNESLIKYFKKWHSGWQSMILATLQPLSLGLAWIVERLKIKPTAYQHDSNVSWKPWLFGIVALEVISALTIFNNSWNAIATLAAGLIVGWVSYKRPTLGLAMLLAELIIGSKGQLLQLWGWPGMWSIRIVIFLAFLVGWGANALQNRRIREFPGLFRHRIEWLLLFVVVGYATIRGQLIGNEFVGQDGNSWGFLLLLFPVLDLASRNGDRLRREVLPVLFVAPLWLAAKTIGLEYLFSHGFPSISPEAYLWVRRTGVGEVTLVVGNAFRIFMQSYIFYIPTLLLALSYYLHTKKKHKLVDWMLIATFVVLGISLSRSLWIGCAIGLISLAYFHRRAFKGSLKIIGRVFGIGIASLAIIFATLAFPIPRVDVASLKDLFGSRISTLDAAAVSRWALFPVVIDKIMEHSILGSGFGATVTYKTSDPRILATNPDGMYTTYAFEWGWLEHWVKFGIFGYVLMIWLVYRIYRRVSDSMEPDWIRFGVMASIIGIAAVHVFSPYLNHPLGFCLLFLVEGYILSTKK